MPLIINPFSGDSCFISYNTLANPPQGLIDNMSGVYITPDGARYVSNGLNLIQLSGSNEKTALIQYPNQANFLGTIGLTDGLQLLSHVSGSQGQFNTAFGVSAGQDLSSGYSNTFVGYQSGRDMTADTVVNTYFGVSGNVGNTFVGSNTAPVANGAIDNTGVGTNVMLNLTKGADNAAVGINALQGIEEGSENAAFGHAALQYILGSGNFATGTGHRNTALGDMAGRFLNSGSNKTSGKTSVYIGARTSSSANAIENENVFGYDAEGRGANTIQIGGPAVLHTHITGLDASTLAPNLYRDSTTHEIFSTTGPVYTAWVPTYAPSAGGALTTVTTNAARYARIGNIVQFNLDCTITNAGTGLGSLQFTLPLNAAYNASFMAFEYAVTGLQMRANACAADFTIVSAPLAFGLIVDQLNVGGIISTGRRFVVSGAYETA